jgi:hypothetical protein
LFSHEVLATCRLINHGASHPLEQPKRKKKDENIKNGLWHTPLPPFSLFLIFSPFNKTKIIIWRPLGNV